MSVIFRTVERPSDPRVENSPKKFFPQLITLGQSGIHSPEDARSFFAFYW